MDEIATIKFKCAELQQKLQAAEPGYKNVLKEIHENIRKTPELMYALADEEIAIIVGGLQKFSGIEIAAIKVKEKITKKQAANLTADDV